MKVNMLLFALACFFISYVAFGNNEGINPTDLKGSESEIKIKINYPTYDGCSFSISPVNFCDDRHSDIISKAFKEQPPNFFKHYILLSIPERQEYYQRSIVAINSLNGEVYPVPIDVYSGKDSIKDGKITFNFTSNKLCIEGDILVYKVIKSGYFCFFLEGDRFTGYSTAYME